MRKTAVRERRRMVQAEESQPEKPRGPKIRVPKMSSVPSECSHTIFRYLNHKRATQVCVSCGSQRRIWHSPDNTATVGEWKHPEHT